jgi:hypothetical protein
MAEEVSEAAKDPASSILQKLFKDVEREILDAFKEHENPLDELAEAIVSSQETYLKRSDAQKRGKTLASLDEIWKTMPLAENDQLVNVRSGGSGAQIWLLPRAAFGPELNKAKTS